MHPSGRICCSLNSVGLDPSGWYAASAAVAGVSDGVALLRFNISFLDVWSSRDGKQVFRTLKWKELSPMHARRVHVSAVSEDRTVAWHVHPDEAAMRPGDIEMTVQLRLPEAHPGGALHVRLLINYGILADRVDLCVDETASHVDPAPGGQELVVEGAALTGVLTLPVAEEARDADALATAEGGVAVRPTIGLEGMGSDEVAGNRPITSGGRGAAARCVSGGGVGASTLNDAALEAEFDGACWGVRLSAAPMSASAERYLRAQLRSPLTPDGAPRAASLLPAAARTEDVPTAMLTRVLEGAVEAPACLGFEAFVRRGNGHGAPATSDFVRYLMMPAHAIIARHGSPQLWHLHFATPRTCIADRTLPEFASKAGS